MMNKLKRKGHAFDLNWIPTRGIVKRYDKRDERLADAAVMVAISATFMILLGVLLYVET